MNAKMVCGCAQRFCLVHFEILQQIYFSEKLKIGNSKILQIELVEFGFQGVWESQNCYGKNVGLCVNTIVVNLCALIPRLFDPVEFFRRNFQKICFFIDFSFRFDRKKSFKKHKIRWNIQIGKPIQRFVLW